MHYCNANVTAMVHLVQDVESLPSSLMTLVMYQGMCFSNLLGIDVQAMWLGASLPNKSTQAMLTALISCRSTDVRETVGRIVTMQHQTSLTKAGECVLS